MASALALPKRLFASEGSLPRRIPYKTTLAVAVKPHDALPNALAPVLVLKDGTIAMALRARGADLYGADNAVLNGYSAAVSKALCGLPSDTYMQAVFESGGSFEPLLQAFSKQSAANSFPLLKRGRQLQAEARRNVDWLTRCSITYWIGWRKGLAFATGGQFASTSDPSRGRLATRTRDAVQLLTDTVTRFSEALRFAGLETALLSEQELLGDCHRAINPTSHHLFPAPRYVETPDDIKDYRAGEPLVLRGPSLASQLPLGPVRWNSTQMTIGDPPILARVLGISRLAETTTPASLHEALFSYQPHRPFRLSVTHRATDKPLRVEKMKFRRRVINGFLGGSLTDHAAQNAFDAQDQLIADLEGRGEAKLFETSITALVLGHDEHDLDQATRDFADGLQKHGIASGPLYEQQFNEWRATLPAVGYESAHTYTLLDHSSAHLTPTWLPTQGDSTPDLLFENRQRGLEGLSTRVGPSREQAGAVILGSTGSGKTFLLLQLLKYGCLDLGGHAVVVDVKGPANSSLRPVCQLLGGKYISLEEDPEASFNIFPPHTQVFDYHGEFLEDVIDPAILAVCTLAMPEYVSGPDRDYWELIASQAIKRAYNARIAAGEALIVQDVIDALVGYESESPKRVAVAAELRDRLQTSLDKSPMRRRLFNQRKHLDLSNPLTVFDFGGMERDPRAALVLMGGLVSNVDAKMRRLPKTLPKKFICDEAWKICEESVTGARLFGMSYRTGRSFGVATYMLTQHEDDIKSSPVGQAILSNSSLRYLLRRIDGHEAVAETFALTERQLELFKTLKPKPGPYAEFLLVDTQEGRAQVLQYWPTPFDYWCDTSRPADVEMRNSRMRETGRSLLEVIEELADDHPHGAPAEVAA